MKWFIILTFVQQFTNEGNLMYCPNGCDNHREEQKRVEMPDEQSCMTTKQALAGTPIKAECLGEIRK